MVRYPHLTQQQQTTLPALLRPAVPFPQPFADSTHQLWQCFTVDGVMMLKRCDQANIEKSSFWQGMNQLFDAQFPHSLGQINQTYQLLRQYSPLKIAQPIVCEANTFVLSEFVDGHPVNSALVNDEMATQLGQHLIALHHVTRTTWGTIHYPKFTAKEWTLRLQQTINQLRENAFPDIPKTIFELGMKQAELCQPALFVPMMIDLRWDQFLQQQGRLTALVDLDAFVYAPVELEWVMLEYLLDDHHAALIKTAYQTQHSIPDLSGCRTLYRMLLFLMNVLGETDIKKWMEAPMRF